MKRFLSLLCILTGCFVSALEITADYQIVSDSPEGGPEEMAPRLLSEHLGKIFGKKVVSVDLKTAAKNRPSIFLKRNTALGSEVWKIRTEGKNLVIEGGFPRGIYYGCCEFLERFGKVRWFTGFETKIPKSSSVTVPDGTNLQGHPAFPLKRSLGDGVSVLIPNYPHLMFKAHHRISYFPNQLPDKRNPSRFRQYLLGDGHTYIKLIKNLPKELDHCLPVNELGRPVRALSAAGPGQICFSNKEFRAYTKKEVARLIAKERAWLAKYGITEKEAIKVVDLSQNDNPNFCQCEGCKALYRKYDSVSGAQLEFINDIAGAFPDYVIQTFAYGPTIKPPKNIKARDNVMIQFAFLSLNGQSCDLLRPLSSPTNAKLREYYSQWNKVCKLKAVWFYNRQYQMTEMFAWPQCCFWYIAEDVRFYYELGIRKFGLETENDELSPRAFHDLHVYLAAVLSNNPYADVKALTEEFFEFQYGPAAPEMKAYAAYLKKRYDAIPGAIPAMPVMIRPCFDVEYFKTIDTLLTRAEKKAAKTGDKGLMNRILLERVPVDYAALNMWEKYGKHVFPSRAKVCDRLEKGVKLIFDRYYPTRCSRQIARRAKADSVLAMLRNPIPVPKGMEDLDIIQIPVASLDETVPDKDALFGRAVHCRSKLGPDSPWAHEKHLIQFGVYDYTDKKAILHKFFLPSELKQDEKYHLYYLGKCVPDALHNICMWGHASWSVSLGRVLRPALNPQDPGRELDIYLSMKVTGPAYVKGSKKENDIWVDKVICVRKGVYEPEYGKKESSDKEQQISADGKTKNIFTAKKISDFALSRGLCPMGKLFIIMRGTVANGARKFDFDPAKKYRISCKVRMISGKSGRLMIGFTPFDKDGKQIYSESVSCYPETLTRLAADAKKGDKVLKLENGSRWKNDLRWGRIVFGAQKDLSDLPNTRIAAVKKGSIAKKGNLWTVELEKPLAKGYKAGTTVRQHTANDSVIFTARAGVTAKSQRLEGTISGHAKNGFSTYQAWSGTKQLRPLIFFSSSEPHAVAEFEDFAVDEL